MSMKNICLSLVVMMSVTIVGSSLVQADSPQERQQKIRELEMKKQRKPHKTAKYNQEIMEQQQKMRMGH